MKTLKNIFLDKLFCWAI